MLFCNKVSICLCFALFLVLLLNFLPPSTSPTFFLPFARHYQLILHDASSRKLFLDKIFHLNKP